MIIGKRQASDNNTAILHIRVMCISALTLGELYAPLIPHSILSDMVSIKAAIHRWVSVESLQPMPTSETAIHH